MTKLFRTYLKEEETYLLWWKKQLKDIAELTPQKTKPSTAPKPKAIAGQRQTEKKQKTAMVIVSEV